MITDSQTNLLYLADALPRKYSKFYQRMERLLTDAGIRFSMLLGTKDVWAVDYMPIQIDLDGFIQFDYSPSYLRSGSGSKTISNVGQICADIGVEPLKSDIILDGGNIVCCANKMIMTDMVFRDNPTYGRKELIRKLYDLLQVDHIYFVPRQPGDFTGHADGMLRFVDEHTLVINEYNPSKENDWFLRAFEIAIHNTGLDCVPIPYQVYDNQNYKSARGCYINYLQMENTLILPTFGVKSDDLAVRKLEEIFSGKRILTLDSNEIAADGGILNCITWNIQTRPL